jgi:hypothetical protein
VPSLKAELDAHSLYFEIWHFLTKYKLQEVQHSITSQVLHLSDTSHNIEINGK